MKSQVRKEYDRHKKNLSRAVKARKKARENIVIGVDGSKKCKKCGTIYSKYSLLLWKGKITNSLLCEVCEKVDIKKLMSKWKKMEEGPKQVQNNDGSISVGGEKWYYHPFYGFRRNKTRGKYIRQRQ